jgi:hypothetical protein
MKIPGVTVMIIIVKPELMSHQEVPIIIAVLHRVQVAAVHL